jgi:hypothetical protein
MCTEQQEVTVSAQDPPHAAHDVDGHDWAETIAELIARGFTANTLHHAIRLAGVFVQEYDSATDDADERRIIAWEKDHRLPFSYRRDDSIRS